MRDGARFGLAARGRLVGLALAVGLVLLPACGDDEDEPTTGAAEPAAAAETTAAAEETTAAAEETTAAVEETTAAAEETTATEETTAAAEDTTAADAGSELAAEPDPALCPADGTKWTFGYDVFSDTQEFAAARWKGLQAWEQQLGCIEFVKAVDNADGATALANVKTFINREVDAVHLLQVVADAQAGIVKALDDAGIPVMATDIPAPDAPFVSGSDQAAGEAAGVALAEAYQASGNADAPWVVLGTAPVAGPEVAKRMQGAKDVLMAELGVPEDQVLEVEVNQQTTQEAYNGTRQAQGRIPDGVPVLVTAVNDELALGMYEALEQAGRDRTLFVVGLGGLSAGLQAVCNYPEWVATVDFDPIGQTGFIVQELMLLANDQPVPDVFYTPTVAIDKAEIQTKYPESCPA